MIHIWIITHTRITTIMRLSTRTVTSRHPSDNYRGVTS